MEIHKKFPDPILLLFVVLATSQYSCQAQNSPQDCVDAHNTTRAEVQVCPITWDENAAAFAQTLQKKLPHPILLLFVVPETSQYSCQAQSSSQDYVDAHNAARAQVGVGPIAWNETVAAFAQSYVNSRLGDCNLVHSGNKQYGENLAKGSGDFTGQAAVNLWVAEKSNYDYNSNSCVGGECLHYTQVVWNNSVRLGCARAQCNNGWWFISCNYDPPGNHFGKSPY
ncbi:hypothetical protein CDL12_11147 [Handroanthus impetiginosus]|uniref:SCP domain-containing protein n=1 Tax=Handroanthus impetiginosus TaxID=429701 RepID=A0A2G9HFC3_9LAMI|nr:hypothetical protein CDL12_11147 [Handroanthus impetiginosus]